MNRIYLAMIGTLIWGTTNIGIGLASTFQQVRLVPCSATSSHCTQNLHVLLQALRIRVSPDSDGLS